MISKLKESRTTSITQGQFTTGGLHGQCTIWSEYLLSVTSSYKNPGINEYIMRFSSMQEVVWQYVHGYVGIMLVT